MLAQVLEINPAEPDAPVFVVHGQELPSPTVIVPGGLILGEAERFLQLRKGLVAMGVGTYWLFWDKHDVLDNIGDMHGGVYLYDGTDWVFQGCS